MFLADDSGLAEEQRMMRDTCRAFVDEHVTPFIRQHWQREWIMTPEDRLPRKILEVADQIGIRTLGVPEEFGGTPLDPRTQVRTFALIAEELSRGDSASPTNWCRYGRSRRCSRTSRPAICRSTGSRRSSRTRPSFSRTARPSRAAPPTAGWATTHRKRVPDEGRTEGDEWVINGRKQFVSNGYDAKLYVVYANSKPGAKMREGTSSFLIPRGTPGFTVARCNETLADAS